MNYIVKVVILILCFTRCSDRNTKETKYFKLNSCNCTDLILDELYNHFYLKERTSPFSGTCYEYFKNGVLSISKQLNEGKMEGEMIRYNKNGSIKSTMNFKQNKINGKAIIYNSMGEDSIVQYYKNGKQIINKPN
jgi:antitoxin component YwqK of YwqJK toxin-antitoxin module